MKNMYAITLVPLNLSLVTIYDRTAFKAHSVNYLAIALIMKFRTRCIERITHD